MPAHRPYTNVVAERVMLLRDAGAVTRSHTCRTLHHRNVAEHSHGVATLIVVLLQFADAVPSSNLLCAALVHDLSEIATGDIPAPVKREHPDLKRLLNRISTTWEEDNDLRFALTEHEQELLLWCDRMDFALYALEEVTHGNRFFVEYLTRILDWLGDMPVPKLCTFPAQELLQGVNEAAMAVLNLPEVRV